jgi:hypothetical protein
MMPGTWPWFCSAPVGAALFNDGVHYHGSTSSAGEWGHSMDQTANISMALVWRVFNGPVCSQVHNQTGAALDRY